MSFQLLSALPEELLDDVLTRLTRPDLLQLNLTSRWSRAKALPLLWKEVELVDCRSRHLGEEIEADEHDDSAIVRKLVLLAGNPEIASCVQTLTHRCHLPPPAIFSELPKSPFSSRTLSHDSRTLALVQLAANHMLKLHTLRIVFGHPKLSTALLASLFGPERKRQSPVKRLWLECYAFHTGLSLVPWSSVSFMEDLNFSGLESLRLRRMPLRPVAEETPRTLVYSRGLGYGDQFQDGLGGLYFTTANMVDNGGVERWLRDLTSSTDEHQNNTHAAAKVFDDRLYESLSRQGLLPSELDSWTFTKAGEDWVWYSRGPVHGREPYPAWHALRMFASCSTSLTSLTLDWIFTRPEPFTASDRDLIRWYDFFIGLFNLRFPSLRAFQVRNAVVDETILAPGLFLLDRSFGVTKMPESLCIDFLEAHPRLRCLAWPMDHFFSPHSQPKHKSTRIQRILDNLGRNLVDLRVDSLYSTNGEPQTDQPRDIASNEAMIRRRRFISEFAAHMTALTSIKIEGGMPRDERREIIRALHASPLKKIVMIGVCSPIGNTWGLGGRDIDELDEHDDFEALEAEHEDAISLLGSSKPIIPHRQDGRPVFEPQYGWPPSAPMLHTIASYHAETVTELKFCGYRGSAVLHNPTPITTPMLAPLQHFHALESLILSLWLDTCFEEERMDAEIIAYWLNTSSPSSTALVAVSDEEPGGWAQKLHTTFSPAKLARRVTNFVGPFLSERAKAREGGIHVRASFCIGDWGGLFDLDLWICKARDGSDVCVEFKGPRAELEAGRRKEKLDGRRWF